MSGKVASSTPKKEGAHNGPATPDSHKRKTGAEPSPHSVKSAKVEKDEEEQVLDETSDVKSTKAEKDTEADKADEADEAGDANTVLPPWDWNLDVIKEHYNRLDPRWGRMFDALPCKPFEHDLEKPINPFRVICDSILGQQISYKAAQAVCYRFVRFYFPHLPDTRHGDPEEFPTPQQVAETPVKKLREIGFSVRKGEYAIGLAQAFVDGRLTPKKLVEASDDELMKMLTAIRGIGPWTVQMLSIFMLRHTDVLPVGDLGVQHGIIKHFLGHEVEQARKHDKIEVSEEDQKRMTAPDDNIKGAQQSVAKLTSDKDVTSDGTPPQLPQAAIDMGLDVKKLQQRLKKRQKFGYLTPEECEALTSDWRPYRSIGVYYMWILKG